jgi:hypothetical protein
MLQAVRNRRCLLRVTYDDAVRGRLQGRRDAELARCWARLRTTDGTKMALRSLGRRWVLLDEEARQAEITRYTSPESLAKARLEVIEGDAVEEVRGGLVAARADDQDDAVELHQLDGRGRVSRHDPFLDTAKQTRS